MEKGSTPKKALLAFLEPFFSLVEGSPIESLVRHIHQQIFRRAPHELMDNLASLMLEGAAKSDVSKKNREALYDTADVLEKLARSPLPKGVKPMCLVDDPDAKAPVSRASVSPLVLPSSLAPAPAKQAESRKGKKRKAKKANGETGAPSCMSPLLLPAPAVTEVKSKTPPRIVRKAKRKKRQGDVAASGADTTSAPRPKKKKRSAL